MFVRFTTMIFALFALCLADMDFKMPANITALKVADDGILVGLDNGELVKYKDNNISLVATLPRISNHFSQNINSKIYQIDYLQDMTASLAEGDNLQKVILLTKDGKQEVIPSPIQQLKQVLILDKNTLILIGPNCEINFYNIAEKKIQFKDKWTISGFEKAVLDRKDKILLIACEGGIIFHYDIAQRKLVKEEPVHKDRIYDIAKFQNRIFTGTPERKARYFDGSNEHWYQIRFPVYKVALNENFGAFTTENSIIIIDKNANKIKEIPYTSTLLTDLEFLGDELVGAGYDENLHFWSIQ